MFFLLIDWIVYPEETHTHMHTHTPARTHTPNKNQAYILRLYNRVSELLPT